MNTGSINESKLFMERARRSIAGGDSSTMRVLRYAKPLVADRGEGCRLWDIDGNEYIDLNMSYGPLILGHRNPRVGAAVMRQITERGSQLGYPTEISVRVAEKVKKLFPSMDLLRFANSGTEALASVARLTRMHTGRSKLVLFEGHYHGWSEALFNRYHTPLEELGDGPYAPGVPGTLGMTRALDDVYVCRWNDLESLGAVFAEHGEEIAGVVMEPVMGNAGVIAPEPGYLQAVRSLTQANGALLVFDEVITGMRVAAGGAQELFAVRPDITVISKALGGGYPVAAFGASHEIMQPITEARLFHGGVYSGNALVMAAAEAVLDEILEHRETMYESLHDTADSFALELSKLLVELEVPHVVHHVGPMLSLLLTDEQDVEISNYRDVARRGQFPRYVQLQHAAQSLGVLFHPNMFEPMFLSTAHTRSDMDAVLERLNAAARECLIG